MKQELTIAKTPWTPQAQKMLAAAVPNCSVFDLKEQVDNGASLFSLANNSEIIGYYVLRIDHLIEHSEGVIIAAVGNVAELDLTLAALPLIEKQFIGCKYIRIHTARAGLVKKLSAAGYQPLEFVMIKGL